MCFTHRVSPADQRPPLLSQVALRLSRAHFIGRWYRPGRHPLMIPTLLPPRQLGPSPPSPCATHPDDQHDSGHTARQSLSWSIHADASRAGYFGNREKIAANT